MGNYNKGNYIIRITMVSSCVPENRSMRVRGLRSIN